MQSSHSDKVTRNSSETGLGALSQENDTKSNAIEIPQISLPKGGGALKGIDEKFQVNTANGTASFSVPLPFSPNRNGFTPQLSLSYNSGNGNGIFGIGWDVDLPAIQRRTDKKLPRYLDTNDVTKIIQEDSFMFSGVEELVPLLDFKNNKWEVRQGIVDGFTIRQYRPRIEGSFSRIERIQEADSGYYWKVTSKENITTFFGYTEKCRIYDPADPTKAKVFQWLPEFAYDDKGSWVWYEYKTEDLKGVVNNIHEKNRFNTLALLTNRHLKKIKYGNEIAKYFDSSPFKPLLPKNEKYYFEVVFDYGEHGTKEEPTYAANNTWLPRYDAFSSYRSGFEVRTYRLCQRVMLFHHFQELGNEPTLVRAINFEYDFSNLYDNAEKLQQSTSEVTYLSTIEQIGYIKANDTYSFKSLPKLTFNYQKLKWNKEIQTVSQENLVHTPTGLTDNYQWTDLYNEGINGILTEQANAWFYKSNYGQVQIDKEELRDLHFSQAKLIMPKPSFLGIGNGTLQLQDLDANGQKQLVVNSTVMQGYFELTDEGEWQPFKAFVKTLNLDLRDPSVKMLDINGDGKPEVILSEQGAFWWWENQGKVGYDSPELATKPYDEEAGAAIVFADSEQKIYFADMSGDGLTDIVRITNGEICYWANLGYGRFGAKVTMSNAPVFDNPELFNPAYLQLTDISGTGVTDIIYLGKNQFKAYLNLSGNAWSEPEIIEPFFATEQPNRISVTDLLGNGTACIVWSSEMPAYQQAPMQYIDLMGGRKPHIMVTHENGMGKKTVVEYKSSTYFYLKDKLQDTPWITKLPFPVQVVTKSIVTESVTNVRFTSKYTYHHGYYDHTEREFRGFGRVEQKDTEEFKITDFSNLTTSQHHQPPVLTKTWFHTGAFIDKERILTQFKKEYWFEEFNRKNKETPIVSNEFFLTDAIVLAAENLNNFDINQLSAEELREALRACKGMTLRQEVFGLDAQKRIEDEKQAKGYVGDEQQFKDFITEANRTQQFPYLVGTHTCEIVLLQERRNNHFASFIVRESEAINYTYERNPEDPRIAHTLNLKTDEFGNVLESVSVVYPRLKAESLLVDHASDTDAGRLAKKKGREGQKKQWIIFTRNDFAEKDIIEPANYYLRKNWQTQTYELTGIKPIHGIFTHAEFRKIDLLQPANTRDAEVDFTTIAYEKKATVGKQKRLIEHIKTKFYNEDLTAPMPDGTMAIRALVYEAYQLAYTPDLLADIFKPTPFSVDFDVVQADMELGGFFEDTNNWWINSGRVLYREGENFEAIKNRFFIPVGYVDPLDIKSEVFYDSKNLFMQRSVDAVGNENQIVDFDYRTLSPTKTKDLNDNLSSVVVDELGLVKAVATEGKDTNNDEIGDEGDTLSGINDFTDQAESGLIAQFFAAADIAAPNICSYATLQSLAKQLLGNASARMLYDFSKTPCVVASVAREQHENANSPLQISFEYTDGLGKVAMKKVQAEAGEVTLPDGTLLDTGNQLRWVGNGRTVLNNKGNPIKQYEPYFSTTPAYEDDPAWVERGVSPTIYYDGAGRNVRTELPNGTFTRVNFDAWKQISYDVNDTVLDSDWYAGRKDLAASNPEKRAADKAASHHNTPSILCLDSLGRPTLGVDLLAPMPPPGEPLSEGLFTTSDIDIEGNALSLTDARGNVVMSWRYNVLGHRIAQTSMDAGKRWILNNVLGNPVKTWDERANEFLFVYDILHRATHSFIKESGELKLISLTEYGETQPNPKANNVRGKAVRQCGGSGQVKTLRYDFKGNVLEIQKQMPRDAKAKLLDWNTALLDPTVYTQITEYDALNRMSRLYNWHYSDTVRGKSVAVYEPSYGPRGVLQSEELVVNAQKTAGTFAGGTRQTVVSGIRYDAKGQRMRIRYGNGTTTCYQYDPLTFRLVQLSTTKQLNEACRPGIRSNLNDANTLQNLFYTYDPTGNIVEIQDDAYKPVFFNGARVLPQSTYSYDVLYRLVTATGREQANQGAPSQKDSVWQSQNFAISDTTLQGYEQRFEYDGVGNILKMRHIADTGSWTRNYQYARDSNHLLATELGSALDFEPYVAVATLADKYDYDTHGNITRIGNALANRMTWDYRDTVQQYDLIGGGNAYYQYSSETERSRKYIENGNITEERLYLGGLERYRRWRNSTLEEEIETLHVFEGQQRIVVVENVLQTNNNSLDTGTLQRFQYINHLGSASLELNQTAQIISYEEYHPYGTTAYQAKNATIKATAKRYRYTGMELDEETGLEYHSARYYLPWLGRWLSTDPTGIGDGVNVYAYCKNSPINSSDVSGLQSTYDIGMDAMWTRMGQEMSAMWTGIFGGSAYIHPQSNTVDISAPQGGAGGLLGGVARAATFRAIPIEDNPTSSSLMGMEMGASLVPIADPAARLVTAESVTGLPADRTEAGILLALDLLPIALEARALRIEARAVSTSSRVGDTSVSLAFRPGFLADPPGPIGHNIVGVNTGGGTQWSHLIVDNPVRPFNGPIITGGDAVVIRSSTPSASYVILEVPVSPEAAARASSLMESRIATENVGEYGLFSRDCTTYASDFMTTAGIPTPVFSTPGLNAAAVAMSSPAVLRPAARASAVVATAERVRQIEERLQTSVTQDYADEIATERRFTNVRISGILSA